MNWLGYWYLGDYVVKNQAEAGYIVPEAKKPLFKVFLGWYLLTLYPKSCVLSRSDHVRLR